MPKTSQNIVILMEKSDPWRIDMKGGNMYLNRFCMEEEAGFELSGVYYLKKYSNKMEPIHSDKNTHQTTRIGMGYYEPSINL